MKTLKYVEGNLLLNKEVTAIGHQANCQNTFGSGIARSIREMYPDAYAVDTLCAIKKQNVLGNFSMAHIPEEQRTKNGTNIHRIFNLYGQNLGTQFKKPGGRMTDYEALYSALVGMAQVLTTYDGDHPPAVVGFPYLMGSALGGGSWDIVSRLIEVAFDGYESDVLIVKLKQ
jgi:O-acetyl-ADP-ribose deacetylase (regulator of RNase III)